MRIVIDMQGAQSSGSWNRGIGRYTMSLAMAMARNQEPNDEILLALNGSFPESVERIRANFVGLLPAENIRIWSALTPAAYFNAANNWRRQTGELVREAFLASLNPDFVLITSLFEGLTDDAVSSIKRLRTPYLTASILYDLIPLIHKQPYLENPDVKAWYLEKIEHLKRADLWLAISESSSREGVQYLGLQTDRCINISTDADIQFQRIDISEERAQNLRKKYKLVRPFIMYTGGIDHRKNIEGLIRAYALLPASLREEHQLAIVCAVQDQARNLLESLATSLGLKSDDVILTGFVPEEDLIAFYNLCAVFVFPSWHEGFGLPALEAMRCGAPVIASDASSLPEVVGLADALFDPHSDEAIARSIERALTNAEFREKLISNAKQQATLFSWDESACRALLAMRTLKAKFDNERVHSSTEPVRLKLAYVSPLPPVRSGIATYSAELLPALAEHYEIDVIVVQEEVTDDWVNQHVPVRSITWFAENSASFDRVLYHFGNSEFHQHMFELLKQIPGVVVLHDFYLSGMLHHMGATGYLPGVLEKSLFDSHGYAALIDKSNAKDVADVIWKYPCSRFVFESSVGTIVHSANSMRLATQWFGIGGEDIAVIPHMREPVANPNQQAARGKLDLPDHGFVVCSFGLLGPSKLNHRLLKVWLDSELSASPECVLVFVGENHGGGYGQDIVSTISNHPNGRSVRITGWVDQDDFKSYLEAANVGVQLRALSRGETSGTVLDCMNYGLATIVNANGSMSDLDASAVWKLPDEFSDDELSEALNTLWRDCGLRRKFGDKARSVIFDAHAPTACASEYYKCIEKFYEAPRFHELTNAIAEIECANVTDDDMAALAAAIAPSFPLRNRARKILVDVSDILAADSMTLERQDILSLLRQWLKNPLVGWHVELVSASHDGRYVYVRKLSEKILGISVEFLRDELIDYAAGDIFFGLGLNPELHSKKSDFYETLRGYGVTIGFGQNDLSSLQELLDKTSEMPH